MAWKYQNVLDTLKVTDCPPQDLSQVEMPAFRWVLSPIDHELNFLPNYEYDRAQDNIKNYSNGFYDNGRKCMRCAQSLYKTQDAAVLAFNKLAGNVGKSLVIHMLLKDRYHLKMVLQVCLMMMDTLVFLKTMVVILNKSLQFV